MTLIFKTLTGEAPEGAENFYPHALVDSGTLLLYDFSNGGTTDGFNVENGAKIHDLATDISLPLTINNEGTTQNLPVGHSLTPGKGFTLDGATLTGAGIALPPELFSYLATNQPNGVAILTFRVHPDQTASGTLFVAQTGTGTLVDQKNLHIQLGANGNLLFRFGNSSIGITDLPTTRGQLVQIAIETRGASNPVRLYRDGQFVMEKAVNNPDGFVAPTYPSIGFLKNGPSPKMAVYMLSITDLTKTEKTAAEVVKRSWEYATATGEFADMEPRDFVNTY